MEHNEQSLPSDVAQLIPREPQGQAMTDLNPFGALGDDALLSDQICAGLEEMSRHLKWLDDDYRSGDFQRVEARARSIVMLADQIGMRQVGQVAADVVYCVDGPDEIALAATLSRLMRLIAKALDQAAGPLPAM